MKPWIQSTKLPLTLQRFPEDTLWMSKEDYLQKIVDDNKPLGLSKEAVKDIVEETFSFIAQSLKKNQKFTYPGFGSFVVKTLRARNGIHPQTQLPCTVPERKRVKFVLSKKVKKEMRHR